MKTVFGAAFVGVLALSGKPVPVIAADLNVYSHRQPALIQPFIKAFSAETKTKVNIVHASKGLVERLKAEGKRSRADVVLTVDIARIAQYADNDLLAPVQSDVLLKAIPSHMRDPENRWFALSKRARLIVVSKSRVKEGEIKTVEDLTDPK